MRKSRIKNLMSNNAHWTINKTLAKEIGLHETLILQQIIDLQCVWSVTEIFQSQKDMAEELGITEHAVKMAIPKLKKLGLISVERKSVGFRNFYKVNEDAVMNLINNPSYASNEPQLTSEVDSTRQLGEPLQLDEYNYESVDFDTTSELFPTMSEVDTTNQRVESDTTITNNITNNTFKKNITNNTTTKSSSGSDKNIIEKTIIDVLIDSESNPSDYNYAIEYFEEVGIDKISEIMEWSDSVKEKHYNAIMNINALQKL
jgi:DNA-binding MarR family transcriptional regulator